MAKLPIIILFIAAGKLGAQTDTNRTWSAPGSSMPMAITSGVITNGNLVLKYRSGASTNLGSIQGPQGATGSAGSQGPQGQAGATGATGAKGDKGDAGTPKRVESYSATCNASSVATITFSPAFSATPTGDVISGWSGNQMVTGAITAISTTGATVAVKRSKGTLLLTDGPFENAPQGTPITIQVVGN